MAGTPHSVKSKEKRTRVPWLALSNLEEWALIREPGQSRRLGCYQPGQQQKIDRLGAGAAGLGIHRGGVDVTHLEEVTEEKPG